MQQAPPNTTKNLLGVRGGWAVQRAIYMDRFFTSADWEVHGSNLGLAKSFFKSTRELRGCFYQLAKDLEWNGVFMSVYNFVNKLVCLRIIVMNTLKETTFKRSKKKKLFPRSQNYLKDWDRACCKIINHWWLKKTHWCLKKPLVT